MHAGSPRLCSWAHPPYTSCPSPTQGVRRGRSPKDECSEFKQAAVGLSLGQTHGTLPWLGLASHTWTWGRHNVQAVVLWIFKGVL